MLRREFLKSSVAAVALTPALTPAFTPAFSSAAGLAFSPPFRTSGQRLAAAALRQVGVTTGYDPAYARIGYPGGDVPRSTGVCADVIVRAARDGLGLDLQALVHADMTKNFAAYPGTWHMARPDTNIDHRRVLNLETFWRRQGACLWTATGPVAGDQFPDVQVGDEVTWLLGGHLPHVGIVVQAGPDTQVVHNIGGGAERLALAAMREQRAKGLFRWPVS